MSSLLQDPDKGVSCSFLAVVQESSFVRIGKAVASHLLLLDSSAAARLHIRSPSVCKRPTLAYTSHLREKMLVGLWGSCPSLTSCCAVSEGRGGWPVRGRRIAGPTPGETDSPLQDECPCTLHFPEGKPWHRQMWVPAVRRQGGLSWEWES